MTTPAGPPDALGAFVKDAPRVAMFLDFLRAYKPVSAVFSDVVPLGIETILLALLADREAQLAEKDQQISQAWRQISVEIENANSGYEQLAVAEARLAEAEANQSPIPYGIPCGVCKTAHGPSVYVDGDTRGHAECYFRMRKEEAEAGRKDAVLRRDQAEQALADQAQARWVANAVKLTEAEATIAILQPNNAALRTALNLEKIERQTAEATLARVRALAEQWDTRAQDAAKLMPNIDPTQVKELYAEELRALVGKEPTT